MDHRSSLANFINVANETDDVMAQKKELMKQIRSKEKNLTRRPPPNLIENIERFIESFQTTNGTWVVLQKALWQADPAIAKRAMQIQQLPRGLFMERSMQSYLVTPIMPCMWAMEDLTVTATSCFVLPFL
jgi:hypothetical protein